MSESKTKRKPPKYEVPLWHKSNLSIDEVKEKVEKIILEKINK